MYKIIRLSLMGAALLSGTATQATAGSTGDMEATIRRLQAQVEALSTKLNELDANQKKKTKSDHVPCRHKKHKERMIQEVVGRTEAYVDQKLSEKEKRIPKGYIAVQGSNTAIKIGGYVKADTIYDAGPFTGDSSQLPSLPLQGYSIEAQKTGFFHMHARESRISVATLTATKDMGEFASYMDGDFFGTNNFGTTLSRAEASSVSSYNFRLHLAYIDFLGFRVGQDWTTLFDLDALGGTVEFNGPTGNDVMRNVQVRYTMKDSAEKLSWAVALENPFTDYTDNTGTFRGVSTFLNGSGGDGFQQLPDLTTMLKMLGNAGHIAVRAVARQLSIRSETSTGGIVRKSVGGWAAGLSGKLKTTYKGGVYAQGIYGVGIGRYIFDLVGQSAAFDPATGRFQAQRGWGVSVGVEQYWTEEWRSNLAYGHSGVTLAKFAPLNVTSTTSPITRAIDQITVNTFYTPCVFPGLEVGLEFDYYLRRTTGHYKGTGKRFQLGIKYAF